MNILDIIIIAVLILAAISGYRKGVIVQIFSLAGILIGVYLAYKLGNLFGDMLGLGERGAMILNFIIILLIVLCVFILVGKICRAIVRNTFLSVLERVGGLVFSVILNALLLGLLLGYVNKINDTHKFLGENLMSKSILYKPLSGFAGYAFPYIIDKGETLLDAVGRGESTGDGEIEN